MLLLLRSVAGFSTAFAPSVERVEREREQGFDGREAIQSLAEHVVVDAIVECFHRRHYRCDFANIHAHSST